MALATQFNLSSKTKVELKGLYIDLFNKLGDKNTSRQEAMQVHSTMYHIKRELATCC
ncbi:MAG: hypothetical protein ABJD02_19140 [Paraglaciecola sp.]